MKFGFRAADRLIEPTSTVVYLYWNCTYVLSVMKETFNLIIYTIKV